MNCGKLENLNHSGSLGGISSRGNKLDSTWNLKLEWELEKILVLDLHFTSLSQASSLQCFDFSFFTPLTLLCCPTWPLSLTCQSGIQ
jgi:hypothetical protein